MKSVVIIDYGRGNLFSIHEALRHIGVNPTITNDPAMVAGADKIILPGVGAFGDAAAALRDLGFSSAIRNAADQGIPLLGICVGCQLLMSTGEEFGSFDGLDLVPGRVARLPNGDREGAMRIPNVGWRHLTIDRATPLFHQWNRADMVYFVHSFAPVPTNPEHVAATIRFNGQAICVAVHHKSITGVQFHPERSGRVGLALLKRFVST